MNVMINKGTESCVPHALSVATQLEHFLYVVNVFQHYPGLILIFITIIVPIYGQRKMLSNLPKNKENEALHVLITKVNELSKRVCIAGIILITVLLTITVSYGMLSSHPEIHPYLSLIN
eukprot:713472_1